MLPDDKIKPNYKPEDNKKCPCLSGKVFSSCCKPMKYEYYNLGKNYKGEEVIVNLSNSNERFNKLMNMFYNLEKDFSTSNLSVSKGIEYLKVVYSIFEEEVNEVKAYFSCQKGCSTCCSSLMQCTAIEAEYIRQFVKDKFSVEQKRSIQNYIILNFNDRYSYENLILFNEKDFKKIVNEYLCRNIPCPFLNEGICSIYEVRPFNCRKHFVFSKKEDCKPESKNETIAVLQSMNPIVYGLEIIMQPIRRYDNLWNPNVYPSQAISKTVYEWFDKGFNSINLEGL